MDFSIPLLLQSNKVNPCFADDLLVMCHGDVTSDGVKKKAFEEFSAYLGLLPNLYKSTLFLGSMEEEEKNVILQVMPFVIGRLRVKYLGVALLAKELGVKYYSFLLDKINKRVNDWKNKIFSYARILQLIAVILESIHVYWASVFLIPVNVIKEINKLLKDFLWNQGKSAKGKAKVAWKSICSPKEQGGMGLKDLHKWNGAMLAKHIWNIAVKKDNLWVKWVHTVKLRDRSIWEIAVDNNDSWG